MSSIKSSDKEKQLLNDTALKLNGCGHNLIKKAACDSDSYYKSVSINQEDYVTAYSFDNIVELKSELTRLWKDEEYVQEFIPIVLASVFKNRPETMEGAEKVYKDKHIEEKNDELLPSYIYTI